MKKSNSLEGLQSTKRTWVMIMLGLFLMIFLVGNVAAAEWDNVKSYDPETNTVTFKNSFLRIIPLDSIGNATLETPQVHQVKVGYSKIAQFTINPYEDYQNILGKIDLIDLKTGKNSSRKIDIKYLGLENYSVDDYSCENVTAKNGSVERNCVVNGSHMEQRESWIDWDKNAYQNKEVTVALFMNIGFDETFEWIPTIAGEKVIEWAVVTSGAVETTDGAYTVVTYLNDGTFNTTGNLDDVQILVVAGGGSGGQRDGNGGGGGGAGGVLYNNSNFTLPSGNYNIVVGNGGVGVTGGGGGTNGNVGQNSSFSNAQFSMVAFAGGYGARGGSDVNVAGGNGGSGGGGGSGGAGGTEIQNDINGTGFGNNGGAGGGGNCVAGGGGGAGAVGSAGSGTCGSTVGGNGGAGTQININGTLTYYGGGGGGAATDTDGTGGAGGGGGAGDTGTNGTAGTGGGGGGAGNGAGGFSGWGGSGVVVVRYPSERLDVVLLSPNNNSNFTTNLINFSANVTGVNEVSVVNVSLLINGTINQTNSTGIDDVYFFNTSTLADGFYNWTIISFGNDSVQYNASNGTLFFTIDTTFPVVSNDNLTNIFTTSLPVNLTWNYSATDTHLDSCYYNFTGNATYTSVTCNAPIITSIATAGNQTFQYCANDTFGQESCGTGYSFVTLANISQADNPDPVGEGGTVTFNLSINTSAIPTTTATLILNNTLFSPTTVIADTDGYYFAVDVDIPLGWGLTTGNNVSWLWNYTVAGLVTNASTDSTNLTVYSLRMDNCSSFTEVIFNMTLYDEGNATLINATAGSDIQLDLTLTGFENSSIFQQFNGTYSDVTSAAVCVPINLINNTQYKIDIVGEYTATTHVVEFFYLDDGTLNSSSFLDQLTNKTVNVYDLLSADSTTFLFSFLDEDNIEVPNAIVHVFRQYIGEGVFREVERGKQDNNGQTHLHLVEEDVIYFFRISLNGELLFTSTTYNAKCLSSPCEIELSAALGTPQFDTNFTGIDGSFEITTFSAQRTVMLQFALNEVSTMNLTLVKQDYTGNFTQVNTTSVTSTGSSLNLSIPQAAGNVTFYAIVYKDNEFVSYKVLNLQQRGSDYFGTTGLIMAALMVLTLVLMAVFEGAGVIVFLILALVIAGAMGVLDLGYYSLVGLICALIILIFKLVQKRR